jgi:hypothetical protein
MRPLAGNNELLEYLRNLEAILCSRGCEDLAEVVQKAGRLASGLSTEFLGESRIALRRVAESAPKVLTNSEIQTVKDVLLQLDSALENRQKRR